MRGIHQRGKRPLSAVIGALVLLTCLAQLQGGVLGASQRAAAAQPPPAQHPAPRSTPPLKVGEQANRRTATSTTKYNGGNSFTTTISAGPVNYRDGNGQWQPISNKLVPDTAGGYAYRNEANSFTARFGMASDSHLMSFSTSVGVWRMQLKGSHSSRAAVGGNAVSYTNVAPGTDVRYAVGANGVEETLTLHSAQSSAIDNFTLQAPRGVHPAVAERADGSWAVGVAGSPAPLFILDAPVAQDASSSRAATPQQAHHAGLSASVLGSTINATISVDGTWLHDPARAFPVRVDPSLTYQPEVQDWVGAVCSGCASYPSFDALLAGSDLSNVYRSALQFGLGPMPPGATVQSASLGLWLYTCISWTGQNPLCYQTNTSYTVEAHQITAAWDPTTTSDQMQFNAAAASSATTQLTAQHWVNWDITSLLEGWLAGTTPNDGIELLVNPESLGESGPGFADQYTTSLTPAYFPKIDVTYTTDAVTMLPPNVVHSNGAELNWTAYSSPTGTPFSSNALYRSLTPNFTPTASTLLTAFADPSVTAYTDTTAAANHTYYYKIVTNGDSWSQEAKVTTPADGTANLTLQPGPAQGKDTWLQYDSCANEGADTHIWAGSGVQGGTPYVARSLIQFDLHSVPLGATINSATLSLFAPSGTNSSTTGGTVHTYRVTRAWSAGTGVAQCTGDGASWYETVGGTDWTSQGGDYDPTADGGYTFNVSANPQWVSFDVAAIAQEWASGAAPNLGILLKADTEPMVSGALTVPFSSDDVGDPTQYPMLTMNFNDGSHAVPPSVAVSTPGSGATVSGSSVTLSASPSGPNPVTQVQFFVDGAQVGSATAAPWQVIWNSTSVGNGAHSLTETVTDSAGSTASTPQAVPITVANYGSPSVSVTAPSANATLTGTVTVSASASAPTGTSVSRVDLYVDNTRLTSLTVAPYSYAWNTLDGTAYDGPHTISATAYDADGESASSTGVAVTLANTSGSQYQATISQIQAPQTVVYDPNNTNTYTVPVSVTNSSTANWSSSVYLCYRWVSLGSSVSADQSAPCAGSVALGAGTTTTSAINVTVPAPTLGAGVDQAQYQLWFDLYDSNAGVWFSSKGNLPSVNWVTVNLALKTALGLENYYQYTQDQVGGGMDHMVNVANGDSLLTWTPFDLPGKGLATVVRLTYNSLEDHSDSLLGNNWSLGISSLTRFGLPLDLHTGGNNPWIALVDGDGTYHRFQGAKDSSGNVYYVEPPGVHLYLRQTNSTGPQTWAFTRPDRTTFYYDQNGFPTSVVDKNGQKLTFTVSTINPSDDPGNLKFHVTAVTDQGGRAVTINYFDHSNAPKPKIRGLISSIIDHDGYELDFTYNDDGNLATITQRGGTNADGSFLADRSWNMTYTASGDGTVQAGNTASESTKVYSITDPLAHATVFNYISSGQDKWKLSSETDRAGSQTTISYNDSAFSTTVNAPLSRTTTYVYDSTGQPTSIQQNLNGTTLTTGMQWNADFDVQQITDANNHPSTLAWTNDGDLTDQTDQNGNHTKLTYQFLTVDGNDTSSHWCPSGGSIDGQPCAPRTQTHLSQLLTKQDPNGVAAGSGYTWSFAYDGNGNLQTVTDPNQKASINSYNADGTLSQSVDANNHTTKYTTYDANGLATTIIDPLNRTTTRTFDADGLLQWTQDPLHQSGCPSTQTCSLRNGAEYRTVNAYDSFGRLGMTTQPKSTQNAFGTLVENTTAYDADNNVTGQSVPFFSNQASQSTTTAYDTMDRKTLVTVPDTAADPLGERTAYAYDAAGRLIEVILPVGEQSGTPNSTHTVNLAYDTLDRQTSQTVYHVDAGGTVHPQATLTCYDNLGDATSVTQPTAGLTAISCPAASTTPDTAFSTYDNAGRTLTQTDADGHVTTTGYDHDGNVTSVRDPNGNTTTSTYDQLNRLTRTDQPFITGSSPHPATTEYQYDNVGNLTAQISPRAYDASSDKQTFSSYVTGYAYDADNELTQTKLPTDSTYSTQDYVLQAYDANGNQTAVSTPVTTTDISTLTSAQEAQTQYFDTGWIYSSQAAGGPQLRFDDNAAGQQTSRAPLTAQGTVDTANEMTWAYLPDGQVAQTTDNGQQPVSYTYSADNVLLSSHNAAGLTAPGASPVDSQNTVDDLDRVVRTDERPEQPANSPYTFASYAYDAANNLTDQVVNGQESSVNGTVTKQGRSLHDDYDQANWLLDQYDCGLQVYSTACPNAQRTLEQFTNTGQESRRELDQSNAAGSWSLKQLNTWDYYANGKVDHAATSNAMGTTLQSDAVGYLDPSGIYVDGNRTSDTFTLAQPSGGGSPCTSSSCTATYTYDPQDHLVASNDGHGNSSTFTLDPNGNILSQATNGTTTATDTYTGNQVATQTTGGTTLQYWYDALGRQSCITTTAGSSADCSVAQGATPPSSLVAAYGYDYLDRLASYGAYANGSQTDSAQYTYDALNRVVAEQETHPSLSAPRTTTFSYAGLSSQLTEEQLSTNQQTTEAKDYGYDPAGHLLSFTDTPYSNGTPQSPTTYTYGVNVHDSVDMLVDPSGGVSASYGYQPYGQADTTLTQGDTSTTSPLNPMRFEQKRLDSGSQSYSTGVRNYSPGNNHFLTPDVFHGALADLRLSNDPLTQNRYALTGGNPTSFIDWSGHMYTTDGTAGGMPCEYSGTCASPPPPPPPAPDIKRGFQEGPAPTPLPPLSDIRACEQAVPGEYALRATGGLGINSRGLPPESQAGLMTILSNPESGCSDASARRYVVAQLGNGASGANALEYLLGLGAYARTGGLQATLRPTDDTVEGAAGEAPDHIAIGLDNGGQLAQFAKKIGARTLMQDPAWRQTLMDAIANPNTKFSVNLDGLSGDSVYAQIMNAAQRGAANDGLTNWEISQLYQAGRLGTINLYQGGEIVGNPFGG